MDEVTVEDASAEAAAGNGVAQLTAVDALPILLVDDRPDNLTVLEAVLAPLGYPLVKASSGAEALRELLEQDFSLILLDVRMPEMDGIETARLIKGRARTRDVPIVFLTAQRKEVGDMLRGYGVGAVDYLMKPFDPELLRSKVAVFAELESSRRALKRSEAFLHGAFASAPIGKTVLDVSRRIVRSNPAFARLVRRDVDGLVGVAVEELAHPEDRERLLRALAGRAVDEAGTVDVRLLTSTGAEAWVEAVVSWIEADEYAEPQQLLVQWVDLTARRRAEQARGELLMEQAARTQAEAIAARLRTLQAFSDALESLSLEELLSELVIRLTDLFSVELAEVDVADEASPEHRLVVSAQRGRVRRSSETSDELAPDARWQEAPLYLRRARIGALRVALPEGRSLTSSEQWLLREVGDRAALSIQRAQLHEQERRIAEELQRGLLPKQLPRVAHVELAAHYQAAGRGAEAGGDWYDAFPLGGSRVGMVVGDVTGRGVKAASSMGQLRSVTRAFALGDLGDEGPRSPGEVLTRVSRYQYALGELEMFTVIYAVVDPVGGRLWWANAGHPPPLLRRAGAGGAGAGGAGAGGAGAGRAGGRGARAAYLDGGNELMGLSEFEYETFSVAVGAGDVLVLYSDGLVERRGESLDDGLERLAAVAASGPEPADELCRHLLARMLPDGAGLHDDVTAMLVRVLPAGG